MKEVFPCWIAENLASHERWRESEVESVCPYLCGFLSDASQMAVISWFQTSRDCFAIGVVDARVHMVPPKQTASIPEVAYLPNGYPTWPSKDVIGVISLRTQPLGSTE